MGKHSDWRPVPKVQAAALGGLVAAAVLAVADVAQVFDLPPGISGLIAAVTAVASGYLKTDTRPRS